jgi:copper chaperone CopZ
MAEGLGSWARGGAVVSAALASMCCILPLGFGVLGLSTTVVAAFFENLRPWFLTLAALLLGVGFYFALRRPVEGEVCSTDSSSLSKLAKPALWIPTIAVLALALFPSISGIAAGDNEELAATTASEVVVLKIEGMTCESCVPGVRTALLDVPGVIDAAISYEQKNAQVRVRSERSPETSALLAAIEKAGYTGALDSP